MTNRFCGSLNPCVAILWDLQNVRGNQAQIQSLSAFAFLRGEVVDKRAYSDWQLEKDRKLQEKLDCEGFGVHSVFSCKEKPSNTDRKLIQDCRKMILNQPHISTVILLSGDGDFTALVNELKAKGKTVIVIAHNSVPASRKLRAAASEFYFLNQIEQWFSNLKFAA